MPSTPLPAAATGLPTRRLALTALASLGAAAALPMGARSVEPDPLLALYAEHQRVHAMFNSGAVASDEAAAPLMARLAEIDRAAKATRPTTVAGAAAAMAWARDELADNYIDPEQDAGTRLIFGLLDNAARALLLAQAGAA